MPVVAMASPAGCATGGHHPPHPHPRGHQHKGQPLQTNLAPQGPRGALLCTGQQLDAETAVKKERRKSPGAAGVCVGSPHSCVPQVLAGSPIPARGPAGEEARRKWWLAENKSLRLGAVILCPNWFPQTKLHCPLTRTNKLSRERLKVTGDPKYLP